MSMSNNDICNLTRFGLISMYVKQCQTWDKESLSPDGLATPSSGLSQLFYGNIGTNPDKRLNELGLSGFNDQLRNVDLKPTNRELIEPIRGGHRYPHPLCDFS